MTQGPSDLFALSGRVAIVTGASGGIGRMLALALAEAGAAVFLGGRKADALERLAADIVEQGGTAFPWMFDITDEAECRRGVERVVSLTDRLDILVNCAGMISRAPLHRSGRTDWEQVLCVNLTAPFLLAKAAAPVMAERGWGRIVNVGSVLSLEGKANALSYVSSKHGLAGLTKALAAELGPMNICVNAICPGYIRTEINLELQADADFDDRLRATTPLRRWGSPADLAGPTILLCSEAGAFINGHMLVVDGGMTATH